MPKKLLVADDSLTIQKVIRLALSGAASGSDGYEIQAVSDGNDAVQQISLFRPEIVLIDVSLPGKSAFEVKRATNQHRDLSHVRFVLMSSAFEKVDEPQVQEVGFDGRLTKPFDPAHLRDVLSQVLAKAPAPSAALSPPSLPTGFPPFEEPSEDEHEPTVFLQGTPPPPEFTDMPPLPDFDTKTSEPESDIRNLTESTIRMSGLAELGGAPASESSFASASESSLMTFPPEPPADSDEFQWSVEEHSLRPAPSMDAGDSTFPLAPPARIPNEHSRFVQKPAAVELQMPPPPEAPFDEMPSGPAAEPAIDPATLGKKIEDMIRSEVEKAIRKAAQETLPDVIERVIKEEIHRLLQDSP